MAATAPPTPRIRTEAGNLTSESSTADSAVGRVTGARCPLSPESAAAYAAVADRYFCFPIVYVEYSGTYGDPAVVKAVETVDVISLVLIVLHKMVF